MRQLILTGLVAMTFMAYSLSPEWGVNASQLGDLREITGGADPKFSCVDGCAGLQGNTAGSCITQTSNGSVVVTCGPAYAGVICGEERAFPQVLNQCKVDPAGEKDPCVNNKPASHCYMYRWCSCQGTNGSFCNVKPAPNPPQTVGSVVSSDDC